MQPRIPLTMEPNPNRQNAFVIALIDAHIGFDEPERVDMAIVRDFATRERDIFGKANLKGHITGSALVLDENDHLLLTFHAKLKRWLQVGGHSDPTEFDPSKTALREAIEESGLSDLMYDERFGKGPVDVDVHTIPARKSEPEHLHLDFRYVLKTNSGAMIRCSQESEALKWMPLSDAYQYDFDPALRRAIAKVSHVVGD